MPFQDPPSQCAECPRLVAFRSDNQSGEPGWFNGAVPSFGQHDARLLIVGLAPGLRGANRTGRPFTGDYAGDLLYATLLKFGLASGVYDQRIDDGLTLNGTLITNAVRCVPPANKPTLDEIKRCNEFLIDSIRGTKSVRAILALGQIAHASVVRAMGEKQSTYKFAHCATHQLQPNLTLIDSYHCSRYNTNTGRLTTKMFEQAVKAAKSAADL